MGVVAENEVTCKITIKDGDGTISNASFSVQKDPTSTNNIGQIISKTTNNKPFILGLSDIGDGYGYKNGDYKGIASVGSGVGVEVSLTFNNPVDSFTLYFDENVQSYPTSLTIDGTTYSNNNYSFAYSQVNKQTTYNITINSMNDSSMPLMIVGIEDKIELYFDKRTGLRETTLANKYTSNINLPSWGIISQTSSVNLFDFNNEINDVVELGVLNNKAPTDVRLGKANLKRMIGYLYTQKWTENKDSIYSVDLSDNLDRWQEIQMPEIKYSETPTTLYQLLIDTIEQGAGITLLPPELDFFSYDATNELTKNYLKKIVLNNYNLPQQSLWDRITNICQVGMLYVFYNPKTIPSNFIIVSEYEIEALKITKEAIQIPYNIIDGNPIVERLNNNIINKVTFNVPIREISATTFNESKSGENIVRNDGAIDILDSDVTGYGVYRREYYTQSGSFSISLDDYFYIDYNSLTFTIETEKYTTNPIWTIKSHADWISTSQRYSIGLDNNKVSYATNTQINKMKYTETGGVGSYSSIQPFSDGGFYSGLPFNDPTQVSVSQSGNIITFNYTILTEYTNFPVTPQPNDQYASDVRGERVNSFTISLNLENYKIVDGQDNLSVGNGENEYKIETNELMYSTTTYKNQYVGNYNADFVLDKYKERQIVKFSMALSNLLDKNNRLVYNKDRGQIIRVFDVIEILDKNGENLYKNKKWQVYSLTFRYDGSKFIDVEAVEITQNSPLEADFDINFTFYSASGEIFSLKPEQVNEYFELYINNELSYFTKDMSLHYGDKFKICEKSTPYSVYVELNGGGIVYNYDYTVKSDIVLSGDINSNAKLIVNFEDGQTGIIYTNTNYVISNFVNMTLNGVACSHIDALNFGDTLVFTERQDCQISSAVICMDDHYSPEHTQTLVFGQQYTVNTDTILVYLIRNI